MRQTQYQRQKAFALKRNRETNYSFWVAMAVVLLMAPSVFAQGDASSDRPGVIERDSSEDRGERGQSSEGQGQERSRSEGQRRTVSPDDDDTGERFNFTPNFDPSFRARNTPGNARVTIDFREADLEEVVKFFSGAMNLNFIVADSLQANKKITIISPQAVTMDEAYRAFLSALEMNDLTIVPQGNFLKIIESDTAISEPMAPYESGDDIPNEARMATAIIPVENANIDEVEEVIGNFVSSNSSIIKYHSNLIVTENAANLRRIRALVSRLDRGEAASNLYVYQVLHADATEVQQQLENIFGEGSGSQTQSTAQTARERRQARQRQSRGDSAAPAAEGGLDDLDISLMEIIADQRTNKLIIIANERSFDRIQEMIEILDVATSVRGEIHVKFLEYANAEDLSQTLSQLSAGGGGRQQEGDREADDGAASLLRGDVQITAHTPSNALVVVASPRAYVALEDVINELDRPQRQVYVEAVIMEIGMDVDRQLELGTATGLSQDLGFLIPDAAVEAGLVDSTQGIGVAQSNFQGIESLISGDNLGLGLGLLGPSVQVPGTGISLPTVALLLQATQTDNTVNVLSTPSILTMDNEEAEIVVGERVPFARSVGGGSGIGSLLGGLGGATGGEDVSNMLGGLGGLGALGGLGGLSGGFGTPIDYEDVGITLRILPQINESDYVRLEVNQEVSDVQEGGLAPIRTRRNIETTVLVRDQSPIVIGGLMRDSESESITKVPFLGDVPVLGLLFRNTSTLTTKQNLVLMLTPYIIEGEEDMRKIYDRKMEEREELMRLFAQEDRNYFRTVNYQKKAGLVERMRRQIREAQIEEVAHREALRQFEEDGPRYQILGGGRQEGRRGQDQVEEDDDYEGTPAEEFEIGGPEVEDQNEADDDAEEGEE